MRLLLKEAFLCPLLLALVFLCQAQSPTRTITGTVKDAQGQPIPGASIVARGQKTGIVSDAQGHFILSLPTSASSIVISYIGYVSQEISLRDGRSAIEVALQASKATDLDEVVVVGYGTQKRRDLTGSVSSVKGNDFKDQPVTSVTAALQGRAAGVEVINSSGAPDAGTPTIIIRGLSSLHQPNPLYIVDGVRVPADQINIQDIASVEVLKDASAAAIYGSAAAGGVILITTKRGQGGKPTINFSTRYGVTAPKVIHMLNTPQYIKLENIVNPQYFAGKTETDTLPNTDWTKALFSNATEQNYNLSVSGSTPAMDYLFSGFYNRQKGVYLDNYSNIGGARVNTNYKLGKFIKVGEQIAVSQRKTDPLVPNRYDLGIHNAPFRSLPIIPVYGPGGTFGYLPAGYPNISFGGPNPVGSVLSATTQDYKNNLESNVYADVKLPLHLDFRTNFSYDYALETEDYYQAPYSFGTVVQTYNSLDKLYNENSQVLTNEVLTYNQDFGKNHINALAGYEQIASKYNNVNAEMTYIGIPGFSFVQTSNSATFITGENDPNSLVKSEFARLNYDFDSRYYLSASVRQDANYDVFGPNKQKGTFAAASVGWNISDENFFRNALPFINLLKLRGSYGTLGNSNIAPYSYASTYTQFGVNEGFSTGGQNFAPNAPLVIANSLTAIPNPGLHWETVTEKNIGMDGEALNGRLYFSLEWYDKLTSDMLYTLTLPISSGFTGGYEANIGNVSSKGLDILLGYKDRVGDLGYDVTLTMGFNTNKVTNLDGIPNTVLYDGYNYLNLANPTFGIMPSLNITETKAGLPFGSFYGYKALGIFKTDAEAAASAQPNAHAGDLIFAHNPKNGTTLSQADWQVIGNPNPKLVYGVNVKLNYKRFDVAMLFNGVAGVQIFNGAKAYEEFPYGDGNTTSKVFGASFLGSNGLTNQPRVGITNPTSAFTQDPNGNYTTVNSYFVESGAYVKLKNLQVGYTLSNPLFAKAGISSARIFFMANNLFTITKYSGLDPELGSAYSQAAASGLISTSVGVTTRGIDLVPQYPQTRIFSAGLDVNF